MTNKQIIKLLNKLLELEISSIARTYILNWMSELKK